MQSSWKVWQPEFLVVWTIFCLVVLGRSALRAYMADGVDAPERWREFRDQAFVIGVSTVGLGTVILSR